MHRCSLLSSAVRPRQQPNSYSALRNTHNLLGLSHGNIENTSDIHHVSSKINLIIEFCQKTCTCVDPGLSFRPRLGLRTVFVRIPLQPVLRYNEVHLIFTVNAETMVIEWTCFLGVL